MTIATRAGLSVCNSFVNKLSAHAHTHMSARQSAIVHILARQSLQRLHAQRASRLPVGPMAQPAPQRAPSFAAAPPLDQPLRPAQHPVQRQPRARAYAQAHRQSAAAHFAIHRRDQRRRAYRASVHILHILIIPSPDRPRPATALIIPSHRPVCKAFHINFVSIPPRNVCKFFRFRDIISSWREGYGT